MARLSALHFTCPGELLLKNDFSEILESFSTVSDLAKCFSDILAYFLFYWQQFFSRVVKTDLYLSTETFCGKNCFVVFMLFWIILGGRVKKRCFNEKSFCSVVKTAFLLSGGEFWGKTFFLNNFHCFLTFTIWAELFEFLEDTCFQCFFEVSSILPSTCPKKNILPVNIIMKNLCFCIIFASESRKNFFAEKLLQSCQSRLWNGQSDFLNKNSLFKILSFF